MKIVNVKIGELFSKLNLLNIEYETAHTNNDDIFIRTPTGDFTKISAFVRKNAPAIRVKTECNKTLIAATNHIVISDKGEEYLKDASTILTIEGSYETDNKFDKIISKEFLGNRDLYDISIPNPHLYVDVNGFIHHNTTLAKALCNEIGVDYIVINGSLDNGIDILRTKILSFASTISLTDAKKVVIIDEADYLNCLEENETIQIGTTKHHTETKLSDLSIGIEYPVVSFNMNTREFENDVGVIVSDTYKEVFEVTLENGQTILVTEDHPFIIQDKDDIKECSIKDGITEKDIVLRQ